MRIGAVLVALSIKFMEAESRDSHHVTSYADELLYLLSTMPAADRSELTVQFIEVLYVYSQVERLRSTIVYLKYASVTVVSCPPPLPLISFRPPPSVDIEIN